MTKRPFKKGFSKYNAKKITIDGHVFDSVAESMRYRELKLLEKSGYIAELELQPCFILQDKYIAPKVNGKKESVRAIKYKADFKYKDISGDIAVSYTHLTLPTICSV